MPPEAAPSQLPDSLWEKELTCPSCGTTVHDPRPKRGSYQVESRDPDFYVNYEGESPYYYQVTVCPNCHFAFDSEQFEDAEISDQRGLESMLAGLDEHADHDFRGERDLPTAVASYELALGSAVFIDDEHHTKGRLNLRASWLYRELTATSDSDYSERREALLRDALDHFQTAYREERIADKRLSGATLAYLIGELHRRLGAYDTAVRWFGQVVNARDVSPQVENMARDQWNRAREQKKAASGEGGGSLQDERRTERAVFNLYRDQVRWLRKLADERGKSSSELLRDQIDELRDEIEG